MELACLQTEPKRKRVSFGENEVHDINNDESLKTGSSQEILPYLDEKTNPLNAAMMGFLESDSGEEENVTNESNNLDISDDQMVVRRESLWLQGKIDDGEVAEEEVLNENADFVEIPALDTIPEETEDEETDQTPSQQIKNISIVENTDNKNTKISEEEDSIKKPKNMSISEEEESNSKEKASVSKILQFSDDEVILACEVINEDKENKENINNTNTTEMYIPDTPQENENINQSRQTQSP